MTVLTVVTAPRPVRVGLRPSKGGSAGQWLPNLYLGTELPRGSVRAVARTGPGWVKMFRLSDDWKPATPPFPTASIPRRSDAGGHKPCSASLGRTPHRSRDVSGLDGPSQKPARVRFSRLASQKCGRAAFQSWCQPAKANTLLGRRRPRTKIPRIPGKLN